VKSRSSSLDKTKEEAQTVENEKFTQLVRQYIEFRIKMHEKDIKRRRKEAKALKNQKKYETFQHDGELEDDDNIH